MTIVQQPNSFRTGPDERGHFGIYGGRFVAETLMPLILDLEKAYNEAKADPAFQKQMRQTAAEHEAGRTLTHAQVAAKIKKAARSSR